MRAIEKAYKESPHDKHTDNVHGMCAPRESLSKRANDDDYKLHAVLWYNRSIELARLDLIDITHTSAFDLLYLPTSQKEVDRQDYRQG